MCLIKNVDMGSELLLIVDYDAKSHIGYIRKSMQIFRKHISCLGNWDRSFMLELGSLYIMKSS